MTTQARRMSLLLLVLVLVGTLSALPSQGADNVVRLSTSALKPFVGQRVTFTAVVEPKVAGRTVRFEVKTGQGWQLKASVVTDRRGRATVGLRFQKSGQQQVRAVALPYRRADKTSDTVTLTVRKRPSQITGNWPADPWQVDESVLVVAALEPATAGRMVWMERRSGDGWEKVGEPVLSDSRGEARVTWTPTVTGRQEYRLFAGSTRALRAAASAAVTREVAGVGPLAILAPGWVLQGDLFEIALEISAPVGAGLTEAVVTLTAPDAGSQVTPPSEIVVDPEAATAVIDFGDVEAGTTATRRLRWQAPADPGELTFSAALTAATSSGGRQDHERAAVIDVLAAPSGGGSFGAGLELTRDSRTAPDHPDQLSAFCNQVYGAPGVPTFAEAKSAADAYIEQAMLDAHAEAWNDEPALDDPLLIDQVVMVALADRRPAAALAAALRGHALAPNDAVHLTNAAVAANELRHPEWAVAFTRQAAAAGPAPSVGAPQEAIRLATQAHAWALLGDRSRAVIVLRDALMVDPDNPQLHAQLGIILTCQGDKSAALPYVRRGMRSDDTGDPMASPEDYPETMRRTWLGASDLFDLSGGTEDTITTPTLPTSWAELVARGRLEGNGYYEREKERMHNRFMALAQRASQLERELNEKQHGGSPAWARRTDDILNRIATSGDRQVQEAWANYLEYQDDVLGFNSCPDNPFRNHAFCFPDNPDADRDCGSDQGIFKEWLNRMRGWETAMNDYHDVAYPIFTGLQANLADPTAHALAGVEIEMHFLGNGMTALTSDLNTAADQFTYYVHDQDEPEDCLSPTGAGETKTTSVSGPTPEFCSAGSIEKLFSLTIDLGIMQFAFDCEKYSVEAGLGAYGFLEAFAKVEQNWNTSAITYYVGVQAGVPVVGSYESALFLETDSDGKVQDLGLESSVSSSAGYVVEVELYNDTARVSAMSYFRSLL